MDDFATPLFWNGKRVFLTGHTGFKGSWLSIILANMGAEVTGYALRPEAGPNMFDLCGVSQRINSVIADIRDFESLYSAYCSADPQIVIHMAAQPLVLRGYDDPAYTYEVNVMGTVNIFECVRRKGALSVLNVTTDKVYDNREWPWGYRETDALCGHDPYSNSKSCSELVTRSYKSSFLSGMPVSVARAGNVIGGGDFAADRIVPDSIRAAIKKESIQVRNPYSVRPYQHVLDPLFAYLMILERQAENPNLSGEYNIGPGAEGCVTTGELVSEFCNFWGEGLGWTDSSRGKGGRNEAGLLKLDCSKAHSVFGWKPVWDIKAALEKTVEWSKAFRGNEDLYALTEKQIGDYLAFANKGE